MEINDGYMTNWTLTCFPGINNRGMILSSTNGVGLGKLGIHIQQKELWIIVPPHTKSS